MNPHVISPGIVEQVRVRDDGFGIIMRAEGIREQRTGLHATLKILGIKPNSGPRFLAGTTCNVTRDEERTKLLNTARRQSVEYEERMFGPAEDKVLVKRDLDIFCFSLADALMAVGAPKKVAGEMLGPLEFAAKPLVLKTGGTILFGPGGSGKSTTAFLCAIAVDSGTNGFWETTETPTLLVNLERPEDTIIRRIFATNGALGLESNRPLSVLTARGKSLVSIEPIVRKFIEQEGIGFVILDSISRAGMGKLVDDDTANMTVDILNSFGIAWLAIGHTSKDNPNEVFGSVHYANGADIVAKLSAERRSPLETGVRIEVTKANDIAFPKPMTLTYVFDEDYGLHTATIAKADEYPDLASDTRPLPQKIYDYLINEAGKASATEIGIALSTDRSNIAKILKADDRFVVMEHDGREIRYAVRARNY
jgi:hypothetical protein